MMKDKNYLYERMAVVIEHLVASAATHPSLADLANVACMSECHFQRTFQEWAGVTPKQFVQTMHRMQAKELIRDMPITEASEQLGYSSESRLYDNFVRFESMTPGDYKSGGVSLDIAFGLSATPFGEAVLAWTDRGLVKLAFLHSTFDSKSAEQELFEEWPCAVFTRNDMQARQYAEEIFYSHDSEESTIGDTPRAPLKVCVKGTVFQVKVWEALLAIPEGEAWSYQSLAEHMGKPESVRAVASAIAKNPVAYLIPCHRVIRSTGAVNQYRWGAGRKIAMLIKELGKGIETGQA